MNDMDDQLSVDGRFWDFTSDLAKGDTAYTTMALGAHTDNTYYVCVFVYQIRKLSYLHHHRRIPLVFNYSIFFPIKVEVAELRYLLMASMLLIF
jgi:hypothetical protein